MGYRLGDDKIGVEFLARPREFSHLHRSQTSFGAQSVCYPLGNEAVSTGVKQLGHETDHLPRSSAEVKNSWFYISIPHIP
jgi:hypothetical protein